MAKIIVKSNKITDHHYVNAIINNGTNDYIKCDFDETSTQPILNNMNDYMACIVRLKIPTAGVPLFIFEKTSYFISFTLGAGDTNLIDPPCEVPYIPTSNEIIEPYNLAVYYYEQFIAMINACLLTLWQLIFTAPFALTYGVIVTPNFSVLQPPYFFYDKTTLQLQLRLPNNPVPGVPFVSSPFFPANPNGINIVLSGKLKFFLNGFNSLFYGFGTNGLNGNPLINYKLLLNPSANNQLTLPPTNAVITPTFVNAIGQDFQSLTAWQSLSRIFITTNMEMVKEQLMVKGRNNQPFKLEMLTDFEIPQEGLDQNDYIHFNAVEPRFQNFMATGGLYRFNFRVFFQYKDLSAYELRIPPTFEFSMKMQFRRRWDNELLQHSNVERIPQ